MNTAPKATYTLWAKYLGPVFSLTADLTRNAQNMIYARNGTGKSFLSRAFRYLDLYGQGRDIEAAAHHLVSEEALDGKGEFEFSHGSQTLGALKLEKLNATASTTISDTIFHVFSDEFVQEELRERSYNIDGDIENQISIDSENIALKDARQRLESSQQRERELFASLKTMFEQQQEKMLIGKASISKQLREYKNIDFEDQVINIEENLSTPEKSFVEILGDLDRLRSLPADPDFPNDVSLFSMDAVDLSSLAKSLECITSPSSVADKIKKKIETHHAFYETGASIVLHDDASMCPFCEQNVTGNDPRNLIEAYIAYFSDEEENHKARLREFDDKLHNLERSIRKIQGYIDGQKVQYDNLRRFVPSKMDSEINVCEEELAAVLQIISDIRTTVQRKSHDLSVAYEISTECLTKGVLTANEVVKDNNSKAIKLTLAVKKGDSERRELQRKACKVFVHEFVAQYWDNICSIRQVRNEVEATVDNVAQAERLNPSAEARYRVADTFELLLRKFFAGKYVFDRDNFILRRGDQEMTRGPERTLSDGDKTAIAFCYFVASIHRKVKSNSDYQRLFLVFDDPVTSMSYDYVFAIAEILKNLNVSSEGEISIKQGLTDGHRIRKPNLLILTHSSYFFNVAVTNKVVQHGAAFVLYAGRQMHKVAPISRYLAPFHQQVKHVMEVAEGAEADHSTGNAIRSVLEAVGRCCRPDKCGSLGEFVEFLSAEEELSMRSVLINSLSHGLYDHETPVPDDLRLACEETVRVVEKYAFGQIEIIRISGGA